MSCACASKPRHWLRLENISQDSDETFSFDFSSEEEISWKEGDSSKIFLMVSGTEQGKKFSHATLPSERIIRFTTRVRKDKSAYKAALSELNLGQWLEISMPEGQFALRRDNRPIFLLSNGVGIAATRALVKAFEKDQTMIPELIQINVDSNSAIYRDEFIKLEDELSTFKSKYLKHRGEFYEHLDYELQEAFMRFIQEPLFYVVGSDAFVSDTIVHLEMVGIEPESIITDGHKSGGTCGCSSDAGCGCGANLVTNFMTF